MLTPANSPEYTIWMNKKELKSLLEVLTSDRIQCASEPFVSIKVIRSGIGDRHDVGLINLAGEFIPVKDITDYGSW